MTDAAPAPAPLGPDAAKAEISRLTGGGDSGFVARYAGGDKAALARMTELHRAAYEAPEVGTQEAPAATAATPPVDAMNPVAEAAAASANDPSFAPGRPEEFKLPSLAGPGEEHSPVEMVAHAETARGWLTAAELPASIGSALAEEVAQINTLYAGLDDGGVQLHAAGERAKLDRLWGAEAPRKIALARQVVAELEAKKPGIVDLLSRTGAGNSSVVIANLANHAERLLARGARRP